MKIFYRLFFILLIVFSVWQSIIFTEKGWKSPRKKPPLGKPIRSTDTAFRIDSPLPLKPNKKIFVDTSKFSKKLALYGDSPETGFYLLVESQESGRRSRPITWTSSKGRWRGS